MLGKNNICIHSNDTNQLNVHQPGYLTVSYKSTKSRKNKLNDFTLHLTWIPNSILQKNKSIEITNRNALLLGRAQSVNEFECDKKLSFEFDYIYIDKVVRGRSSSSNSSTCSEEYVMFDCKQFTENYLLKKDSQESALLPTEFLHNNLNNYETNETDFKHNDLNSIIANSDYEKCELLDKERKLIRDSIVSNEKSDDDKYSNETVFYNNWRRESISSRTTLRKFCVDLGEMKSIRLFFSENDDKNGQLVIASKENQYKVLHFHHGGLEKLLDTLLQWDSSVCCPVFVKNESVPYKHFIISRSHSKETDFHSDDNKISEVTYNFWYSTLNEMGQIEEDVALRKAIFYGGLHKSMRKIIWPFLLNCYSYHSTMDERNELRNVHKQEYIKINKMKQNFLDESQDNFLKTIQHVIHEDVIRTDRMHPYYSGINNPNLITMKNILLNYAVFDCNHGYTQGMSDLLSPILAEIQEETETFWCFVSLMKRCLFVCTPTDSDMEKNLIYLRELIRLMHPKFYSYLKNQTDGMDLLFCHRWLLLCFKREFSLEEVLRIWESCWSNYLTNHFHLFVCLAIIITHSDDVMNKQLKSDEMLFHFNSLAKHMNGSEILKKARKLLYSFRLLTEIPPMLGSLCQQGPDGWDNRHIPIRENTD